MIELLKSINNSKKLEAFEEVNLDQLMLDLIEQKNYEQQNLLNNQSIISYVLNTNTEKKLVLFIFNRAMQNINFPYKGPFKLVNGKIDLVIKSSNEINEVYKWLKEVKHQETLIKTLHNGDYYDYKADYSCNIELNIHTPGTAFIQLISNNNLNFINIKNFLYQQTELSSKNRRLLKLCKNYYSVETSRDIAKEKFYKILDNLSDQQIFQAYFIEKHVYSITEMQLDFESYMKEKYKDKYFNKIIEIQSE